MHLTFLQTDNAGGILVVEWRQIMSSVDEIEIIRTSGGIVAELSFTKSAERGASWSRHLPNITKCDKKPKRVIQVPWCGVAKVVNVST